MSKRDPVIVTMTAWASLVARRAQERVLLRRTKNCWHHHLHLQLDTSGMHVRNDIRSVTHEIKAMPPRLSIVAAHSTSRGSTILHVQAVHLEIIVVTVIQRPPSRWDTTVSNLVWHCHIVTHKAIRSILHLFLPRRILFILEQLHPWRRPGQMLDRAVKLLPFSSPLHGRSPYVLANLHQRVHEAPNKLLVF